MWLYDTKKVGVILLNKVILENTTLLLLLLTGTIFSYFCMSSITSVLILAIFYFNDIHSY